MPKKQTPHDGSYRRLFSHARMVRDLIERYVAPPWMDRLDFETLEMVPAHYVSEELEQRESDVVWRLRYGPEGDWFYVYILIEFQSEVLRFMAIRVLTYVMLLYEDLIRKKRWTSSRKLPPVVPIVLYNGESRWAAPLQVADLVESIPGQERHVPRFECLVIDEGHLPQEQLEPLDNPVAGVFQLERSTGVAEIRRIIDSLLEILGDPELRELRRDMATWLRRAVLPARLPGIEIPELQDLQEAKIMLAERAARWPKQWMAEGYQKGVEEGRNAALLEGRRLALTELISEKFGTVESRYQEKIAGASEAELKKWLTRILSTTTISDLFQD
ncbi:MAG: Rpn family recombination-promoting nuclease/putative transposase [bacterium]|nr:Rpn family recombination-promoting nuclease/putative transposase [bacterium]